MTNETLDEQVVAFQRLKSGLLERYGPHEWVIIADGKLQEHFSSFSDAARYVAKAFGTAPALVRQIEEKPEFVPFIRAVS